MAFEAAQPPETGAMSGTGMPDGGAASTPGTPLPSGASGRRKQATTMATLKKRLLVGDEEVSRLEEEGRKAIKLATKPQVSDQYKTYKNKVVLQPGTLDSPNVKKLIDLILDWLNEVLAERRILLRDFFEDFCDGQILTELLEELTGSNETRESALALSEGDQRVKLSRVIEYVNRQLRIFDEEAKWSVEAIYLKDPLATLHLLVALSRLFEAPIDLPRNVRIRALRMEEVDDKVIHEEIVEEITGSEDGFGNRIPDKDVFDRLFEQAPDKLQAVENSLLTFVNKHLAKIKVEVVDVGTQFHDGVNLIHLMCLLERYCLPFCSYNVRPKNLDQKLRNVKLAMQLMADSGVTLPPIKPDDIVHKDLKSTLRVLYGVYSKFKFYR
ncbi:alpha-parvin-like [Sycon ciliatum]|uniref:alpha-parvin-like n=1 Tax=Sycon ciliatum TaxID=27933 RepID=UPI0031F66B3D